MHKKDTHTQMLQLFDAELASCLDQLQLPQAYLNFYFSKMLVEGRDQSSILLGASSLDLMHCITFHR